MTRKSFRLPCIILLLLLYQDLRSTATSQENHKRRHEGGRLHEDSTYIPEARWDIWGTWSPCSVDCGIGISSRSRNCRSMIDGSPSNMCFGKDKDVRLCQITGCIKQVDNECTDLQNRVYGGQRYRWVPYKHPSRECETACRPIGAGFYIGLGKNVSDGSPCRNENHVCISGVCKLIGCDGVVESEVTVDRCGECGGDGSSCKHVHKLFSDDVQFGYHTIDTVPRGSTNILIKEAAGQSRNYLAMKTSDGRFQINTDFRLSRFGEYPAGGTIFVYQRSSGPDCPEECITAAGPTEVSVDIMLLAYTDNKGVEYSYHVPASYVNSDESKGEVSPMVYIGGGRVPNGNVASQNTEKDERKLPIFSSDFKFKTHRKEHVHGQHEGVIPETNQIDHQHVVTSQTTTSEQGKIDTIETTTERYWDQKKSGTSEEKYVDIDDTSDVINRTEALHSPKSGVITEDDGTVVETVDMYNNDNRVPSLYSWTLMGYTDCSQTCDEGKQYPKIECMVTDKKVKVENTFCSDLEKPAAVVKACHFGPCPPSWKPGAWSKCSVTCGTGYQTRDYRCVRPNGDAVSYYECSSESPRREDRACDMGSCSSGWYFTEWPEHCPASCAYGTITRQVHCISDTGNERTACPERERPATGKGCRNDDCGGFWLTGPWSECNATCGDAVQNRAVVCAQRQGGTVSVVSESACVEEERPPSYISCDLKPCGPEWYMIEWSQCSVTCGSGYRSRDVKCLDRKKRPATGCDLREKPDNSIPCTERECPPSDESRPENNGWKTTERPEPTRKKPTQTPECKDRFVQCKMVLQARLCKYAYYQELCCETCGNT